MLSVDISGDKKLVAKLERLSRKDFSRASRVGAKIVQARVKQLAPVRSGALKKAVKVKSMKRSRVAMGTRVSIEFSKGRQFYGSFLELGTKKLEPLHFMKKAAEEVGKQALDAMINFIRTEIK